jgi:hypothetical protein
MNRQSAKEKEKEKKKPGSIKKIECTPFSCGTLFFSFFVVNRSKR